MKYLMQFGVIIGVSLVGNMLNSFIPLPVPGSVWGMILMFICLASGLIKLEQVQNAADFLLGIMTVMFVPVGAGLITSFGAIKNEIIEIFAIIIVSTVICFFVTGRIAQFIMDKHDKKEESKDAEKSL